VKLLSENDLTYVYPFLCGSTWNVRDNRVHLSGRKGSDSGAGAATAGSF
jgi:hypothetical protein